MRKIFRILGAIVIVATLLLVIIPAAVQYSVIPDGDDDLDEDYFEIGI